MHGGSFIHLILQSFQILFDGSLFTKFAQLQAWLYYLLEVEILDVCTV